MAVGDLHWRIFQGVAAGIIDLDLPLITDGDGSRVFFQLVPGSVRGWSFAAGAETDVSVWPACLLTTESEIEDHPGNDDTGTRSLSYPVRVWLASKTKEAKDGPAILAARKQIWDLFDDAFELDGVPELCRCVVTPTIIFDPQLPAYSHVLSGLLLRFETSEPR